MSRARFHAAVTESLFFGSLPDWQRRPLDLLIDEGVKRGRGLEETAYVLATAYHETGRFKWMEEIGKGAGKVYGEPVTLTGTGSKVGETRSYHGRGFVQLTWLANYADWSVRLGENLVANPDRVKDPAIAARIIWDGMIEGAFTGRNLADHIRQGAVDYVGARRIVNGLDHAEEIAATARAFEAALRLIGDEPEPALCDACPYRRTA